MDGFIPYWNVKRCTILTTNTKNKTILKLDVVKINNMNTITSIIFIIRFHQYQNFHAKPIFNSSVKLIMIVSMKMMSIYFQTSTFMPFFNQKVTRIPHLS
jgi:hypothetical protein